MTTLFHQTIVDQNGQEFNLKKIAVIGVTDLVDFETKIVNSNKFDLICVVDLWDGRAEEEKVFDELCEQYSFIHKFKKTSKYSCDLFVNGYFDALFFYTCFDSAEEFSLEMLNWKNKLRRGGIVSGYNYNNANVCEGLMIFSGSEDFRPDLLQDSSWFFVNM